MLLVLCLYTIWEGGDISIHQWFMDVWSSTWARVRGFYGRMTRRRPDDLEATTPEQSTAAASPGITMEEY